MLRCIYPKAIAKTTHVSQGKEMCCTTIWLTEPLFDIHAANSRTEKPCPAAVADPKWTTYDKCSTLLSARGCFANLIQTGKIRNQVFCAFGIRPLLLLSS
jgi:hypothetical protein